MGCPILLRAAFLRSMGNQDRFLNEKEAVTKKNNIETKRLKLY